MHHPFGLPDQAIDKADCSLNSVLDGAELTKSEESGAAVRALIELVEQCDDAVDVPIDELGQRLMSLPAPLDEILNARPARNTAVRSLGSQELPA